MHSVSKGCAVLNTSFKRSYSDAARDVADSLLKLLFLLFVFFFPIFYILAIYAQPKMRPEIKMEGDLNPQGGISMVLQLNINSVNNRFQLNSTYRTIIKYEKTKTQKTEHNERRNTRPVKWQGRIYKFLMSYDPNLDRIVLIRSVSTRKVLVNTSFGIEEAKRLKGTTAAPGRWLLKAVKASAFPSPTLSWKCTSPRGITNICPALNTLE